MSNRRKIKRRNVPTGVAARIASAETAEELRTVDLTRYNGYVCKSREGDRFGGTPTIGCYRTLITVEPAAVDGDAPGVTPAFLSCPFCGNRLGMASMWYPDSLPPRPPDVEWRAETEAQRTRHEPMTPYWRDTPVVLALGKTPGDPMFPVPRVTRHARRHANRTGD